MRYSIASLRITRDNLVEIRDNTRAVGELFGLDKLVCTRLITAVSEIARNAAQHAVDGAVTFFLEDGDAGQLVVADITDRGPGIRDLAAAMSGTAHGSLPAGRGLASSKRLVDRFSIEPVPGGGTLVSLGMARSRAARPLRPGEITALLDVLARRKPRSPLEEVEQQNQEMLHTLQALKDRQGELELADQRKNEFVATLAHELRNPLGTLQMTLHILRHKPEFQQAELVGHLAVMSRQAQQLHQLVTDLMDVSRVSQGKVELHKRPTDVNELVSQALEMTGAAIKAKEHHVELTLSPEQLWVDADSTRIKQVLSNILHNAARYSPESGRIAVRVKRAESQAVVEVSDSGMGIPADLLPHVFGLFVQGSHHTEGGLGVGLALAQRLVHDHAGTISASSAGRGRGSQFTVTLPLCPPQDVPKAPGLSATAQAGEGAQRR